MSENKFQKFKTASEVGMMVAIAKTFFFNSLWQELTKSSKIENLRKEDSEMLRRHMKEAVASMDDNLFFFPPDNGSSIKNYEDKVRLKLSKELRSKILAEFKRRVDENNPTLARYLQS